LKRIELEVGIHLLGLKTQQVEEEHQHQSAAELEDFLFNNSQ